MMRMLYSPHRENRQAEVKLVYADLTLDVQNYQIVRNDQESLLTAREFILMRLFMLHPEETLTRQYLFKRVWGDDSDTASNVLDVYVRHLRKKMEHDGASRLIHTVRSEGYVLRCA
ncbi:MAG: winged helix-turn-helix domain-containing protein [Anaerolineae bacterium]|nr:winged helix-turn-helix domain-containing protein [Anaerolineae bacterium]